ncbi:hypothetical protein [Methanobacterium formicicum]|jgi:hypothetical protein|uniref:Putative secreted protein n=1 Tax=Methanobacterium formicicum TaxID=2162 RepID=A0A090JSR0_METFO|nr:hypothetical protein [Methanobacterium formicicum]MDH2658574.1 hypothetical protein [Methanobacterium formicicum]CEA12456.1 putative secreted protein [Methanobacterium formicicum]
MGEKYLGFIAVLVIIGLIVAVSGCTSSSSEKNTNNTPNINYLNFTANGVSFKYMSDYMTVKQGTGNIIAELNYTTLGSPGYVVKYPGMSLESLKSKIELETYPDHNITETKIIGKELNYNGYRINSKAKSPYNMTEDYIIFETGGSSYEISIFGESGNSLSYIINPIEQSIYVS